MKTYQSHKKVQAGKITGIDNGEEGSTIATLTFEDATTQEVSHEWLHKHEPVVGGYFVQYADGYQSFSPASAFEEGYDEVTE